MKKLFTVSRFSNLAKRKNAGFTLIEILVVIGIIALLATIVIVAINPARQFAQARNTQRVSNVNSILNAIGQRIADNKGIFDSVGGCPAFAAAGATSTIFLGTVATPATEIDLATNCLVPTYISALPVDPDISVVAPSTGYTVSLNTTNRRVMVCAPLASNETAISATPPAICITR